MTRNEAIELLESYDFPEEDPRLTQAAYMGAGALRDELAAESPLTLEELREMDGEPVWIVEYPDWGHWELSENAEDYLTDRTEAFYGMRHNDPDGKFGLHKLGWLAYRRKPEEVGT